MLRPIRWNTFIRDFFVIQIGFLLYGLAIALIVRADVGTGTWVVLEVALADILGIKLGTMTVYMGFAVLVLALALRERVGWGTLGNILSIGPWLNLFLDLIPTLQGNLLDTTTILQVPATVSVGDTLDADDLLPLALKPGQVFNLDTGSIVLRGTLIITEEPWA